MDYQELISGFVLGLISGFFVEYIRHHFSVKRSKKEGFLPYLRKLYGSVSEIMKKTDAKELSKRYDRLFNAKVKEKIRESAIMELTGEEHIEIPEYMRPAFSARLMFFIRLSGHLSRNSRHCFCVCQYVGATQNPTLPGAQAIMVMKVSIAPTIVLPHRRPHARMRNLALLS